MAKTKRGSPSTPVRAPRSARASLAVDLEKIDSQIIALLVQRAAAVASRSDSVGVASVADAQRAMRAFVERQEIADALTVEQVQDVMRHIVSTCITASNEVRVAYLGPRYSYSYLAAVRFFGDSPGLVPVASIAAVFESIVRHESKAGVVPIENSTDGRVVDTLGMFLKHRVRIRGELLLPIHHNLLSRTPRAEITEVYSKPQALSQCRDWLSHNLPAARLVEMSSTAAAAQLAAERPGAAAVASIEAGIQYGLNVVDASIEDHSNNVTRFAILGNEPSDPTGNDKTSLLFQVDHKPGALADAMVLFKRAKLNLTWIESFPLPGSRNEYLFFVEVLGHETDAGVAKTITALGKRTRRIEILGSYPRGSRPEDR